MREIKRLLLAHLHAVAPWRLLGEALHYVYGQWPKLVRLLKSATQSLYSNQVENAISPIIAGRHS